MGDYQPSADDPPYARLGGEAAVRALAERFYSAMDEHEPALALLHPQDENGRVAKATRERFALFLIGWLGGPQEYVARHGHPRLRMRHGAVRVDEAMRDAWMRCMKRATDHESIPAVVREYLDVRFAEVANFLRNSPG